MNQQQVTRDYLRVEEGRYNDLELLQSALSTKLFTGKGGLRSPVHRHTAEYIGARYLASVIDQGLPAARILSLMVGEDGIVVSELRGLSAWLATLSKPARDILIDIDPVGIGQYGDISSLARKRENLPAENAQDPDTPRWQLLAGSFRIRKARVRRHDPSD